MPLVESGGTLYTNPPGPLWIHAQSSCLCLQPRLLDLLLNLLLQALRLRHTPIPRNDFPITVDQHLLEVPLHPFQPEQTGFGSLHPLPNGLRLLTVDIRLTQHRECDAVVDLAEVLDLVVRSGILIAELVRGEAEDDEGLGPVFLCDALVQCLQAGVLGGEAALAGGVDCEDHLSFVLF